ncbi:MarR family winged helix-turn-helix transcriptional regulator [Williamsia sterculiae]|nr:MarR family transcriptional regulator [Williamsia sterculiae]
MADHDDDIRETAFAVRSAVSLMSRRARESNKAELGLPERAVLSRLNRHGPDTTAGLARWEEISPQSMGTRVVSLEARGLISRDPDPDDGRRIIVTITDEGRDVVLASRGQFTDRLTEVLAEHFSLEQRELIGRAAPLIEHLAELL